MAALMDLAYSPTGPGAAFPCWASSFTMADPMMIPSAWTAIALACSGVDMPNPMAQGTSVDWRISEVMAPTSVVMLLLTPVTPSEDTTYTKPRASDAIIEILDSDVGATIDTRASPRSAHWGSKSAFSSYGTSGRMIP